MSIEWLSDVLQVTYSAEGFDPDYHSGSADALHVHFFFSSIPISEAGNPGAGPWKIWDLRDGRGETVFNYLTRDNLGELNYQTGDELCVTIATSEHAVLDEAAAYCTGMPLPPGI
jgi:hypothetical protein